MPPVWRMRLSCPSCLRWLRCAGFAALVSLRWLRCAPFAPAAMPPVVFVVSVLYVVFVLSTLASLYSSYALSFDPLGVVI